MSREIRASVSAPAFGAIATTVVAVTGHRRA